MCIVTEKSPGMSRGKTKRYRRSEAKNTVCWNVQMTGHQSDRTGKREQPYLHHIIIMVIHINIQCPRQNPMV
jgi:hypothetical protein